MDDRFRFRAWDKEFCRMKITGMGINEGVLSGENIIIMQCTGLRDKAGKLIFEGDIVLFKWTINQKMKNIPFTVQWINGQAGFMIYPCSPYKKKAWKCWLPYGDELEIIGNIYEQPELLK